MRVIVAGDFKEPILFSTDKATALFIDDVEGIPAAIYKFVKNKNCYIRLSRGEDKDFDTIAKQFGFDQKKSIK